MSPQEQMPKVFTIGHSNHPTEHFLDLLRTHGVTAVADVRSKPYTKYAKHFCREQVERLLRGADIHYVFMGDQIGGKPDDPDLLGPDGKPDYARIAASPGFAAGIDRLVKGASTQTIALMCGEEDPSTCHRSHLIVPALAARGVQVRHIRGDASLVDAAELSKQLAQKTYPTQNTLFS
jgi:uncharacterized protein (DUF488 family)